ncbi:glycosyltransferase [Pseudomonas sp. JDS28PS106]|uniref:glycosyltransferase n=1 Tax=Pseudomonas sp. JDS28PS106 TaxID=2497235 RepID=UPI002FD23F36
MSHFGVVAPPFYSHFQALQALAQTLIERGHRVTFFHQVDARRWLTDTRIGFHALGQDTHPAGSLQGALRQAANPSGPLGLIAIIRQLSATTAMLCDELPAALAEERIDALLCDQMEAAGGLVAEGMGLPFVSVACALPVNREPGVPLPVMPFAYATDESSQRMYQGSTQVYDWLMKPLRRVLHDKSQKLGVPARDALHECLSPLAQISQTIAGFDFPRQRLPEHFHGVGPLRAAQQDEQGLWPIDPQRPLVFASLGTLQGSRLGMFRQIATACRRIDAQLLVAHCGGLGSIEERLLLQAGATWVTDFAPQRWALQQAAITVTHGGLNTVMDAIAARTPMLVMPIAFDQPGVAARVAHAGVGLQLSRRARASRIATQLQRLMDHPLERLDALAENLSHAGGVQRAADIVERAVTTRQAVPAFDIEQPERPCPAGVRS